MKSRLNEMLDVHPILLLDGAMGTMLATAELPAGGEGALRLGEEPAEWWNIEHPARVRAVHRACVEAGAQVLLTNSFGANPFRLAHFGLVDRVVELNRAAANLARAEAERAPHPVLIAGSIGPSGLAEGIERDVDWAALRDGFAEQVTTLSQSGVDVLWIETMGDLDELRTVVAAAQNVSTLPVVATLSFDHHGRTRAGVSPDAAMAALAPLGLAAIGANCGSTLTDTETALRAMRRVDATTPLICRANAGLPRRTAGGWHYDITPAMMADHARRVLALGARLIGGCCGTTPAHIRAMGEAMLEGPPVGEDGVLVEDEG